MEPAIAADISQISPSELRRFTPIGELTHSALHDLMPQSSVRSVPPGSRIFAEGDEDDWSYFLLAGTVELTVAGTRVGGVSADSATAALPLSPIVPRQETARAQTATKLFRVPRSLLEVLLRPQETAVEVTEIEGDSETVENRLLCQIFEDYVTDRLEVPSLPDVALKIRKAVEDPDVSATRVERIVTADPAVAARLIQVANSPAYAGSTTIESCRDAVTRLGLPTTRDLVTSILLKQLFNTSSALLERRMYDLWQHSTRVAAICFHLATVKPGFNPDRALLAGLVHDIGVLPILARAEQYPELCNEPDRLAETVSVLRGQFGSMVLRRWGFPADLVETAMEAEDWQRDPDRSPDYCDLVLVSQLLSFAGTRQISRFPALSTVPAFKKLALGDLDPEKTLDILDSAQQTIDELQKVLAGGSG